MREDASTKHEQIMQYIADLEVGQQISVRRIAKELHVSEGTAYRAIKDAENQGLVHTRPRIGTVRVGKQHRYRIDQLTFRDVVMIVDGEVLGGQAGLDTPLHKFVIGAMELDDMMKYIDAGSLLIVGNREGAHRLALEQGSGVLVTGGFHASDDIRELADASQLPVITSGYDTFTVASMINRAIYDRLIKKKIILVEDLIHDKEAPFTVKAQQTVGDWIKYVDSTGNSRFPVTDEWNRVIGMVTPKDILDADPSQTLDRLMTRNPLTVGVQTSIASAAHMMVWEGIEVLPVVDGNRKLRGIISRQDVLKAMQYSQRQPQIGETFEDLMWSTFEEIRDEAGHVSFRGSITPQMTGDLGVVSEGVLATLMTKAAFQVIKSERKGDLVLDNASTYFIRPLQLDTSVEIIPNVLEISRKFAKVDVEMFHERVLICKALLTAQVLEQR